MVDSKALSLSASIRPQFNTRKACCPALGIQCRRELIPRFSDTLSYWIRLFQDRVEENAYWEFRPNSLTVKLPSGSSMRFSLKLNVRAKLRFGRQVTKPFLLKRLPL